MLHILTDQVLTAFNSVMTLDNDTIWCNTHSLKKVVEY